MYVLVNLLEYNDPDYNEQKYSQRNRFKQIDLIFQHSTKFLFTWCCELAVPDPLMMTAPLTGILFCEPKNYRIRLEGRKFKGQQTFGGGGGLKAEYYFVR